MTEERSPRVLDGLALAHFLAGQPAEAVKLQRRALELLGDSDPLLAAELAKKLERYQKAAEA